MLEEPCAFHINSSQQLSGWIHSPNYPGLYPRDLECNYLFFGDRGTRVLIHFIYFDVEGVFPCDQHTGSDYVELSNFLSVDRKFSRKCGRLEKLVVQSDGRFFRVTFRSNDRLDGTGFRASFAFEKDPTTTEAIPEVRQFARTALEGSGGMTTVPGIRIGIFLCALLLLLEI